MHTNTFPKKQQANIKFQTDALAYLSEHKPLFREISYFKTIIEKRMTEDTTSGRHPVVVLGTAIPEELITACGVTPYFILGGDPGTVHLSDDLVPRDTDPVSRSAFGMIRGMAEPFLQKALIIVPLINDSSRKLAYILKSEGRKVCTVDIPPVKSPESEQVWLRQIENLSAALEKHTGRWMTKRTLDKAQKKLAEARQQMYFFSKIASSNPSVIPGTWRMLILQSYYYADDIETWTEQLAALSARIAKGCSAVSQPIESHVLLMGSPVYFPNYKIPFLIEDAGMGISAQLDYTSQRMMGNTQGRTNLSQIANEFYYRDASAAYSKNDAMFHAMVKILSHNRIDGVVYHVLKGQIEYDFELERLEEVFSRHFIPVCRLETDYSYQDVEQLRIRIDAFREVLAHRNHRKESLAV